MTPDWTDDTNGPLMGRASLLTLTIVAGLRQGLAVGQHGHFRHGHAHHGAFFVSLVLNTEERDEETQSFLHGKSWFDWKKKTSVAVVHGTLHSFLTSIYAGSVLAVGMCGCQSLEGLVRYLESVTTHFRRGQPTGERHWDF